MHGVTVVIYHFLGEIVDRYLGYMDVDALEAAVKKVCVKKNVVVY